MKPLPALMVIAALMLGAGGCTPRSPQSPPADREFTLQTAIVDGRMAFVGVGDEANGAVNPDLVVQPGESLRVVLVNGDGLTHDLAIPDLKVATGVVASREQLEDVWFEVDQAGNYAYYCTVPGHRQAGMEGRLVVVGE